MKMNEVRAADGNNKTLWLNKFLPHQNPYLLEPRQGESSWVEMSVPFARRLRCFRVKIEDLQTAELAYIRRGWWQTWRVLFEMQNHHSHSYRAGFSSHMVIHLNPKKKHSFLQFGLQLHSFCVDSALAA